MLDLVSVIVPVYKVEKYLSRCIESILNQTYKNIEIILINDGSPDKCPEICDEYAKIDNRVIVIHQANRGPSSARNKGLDIAKGKYIMFIDSDDFISKITIEEMLINLIDSKADITMCSYLKFYNRNEITNFNQIKKNEFLNREKILEWLLDEHEICVPWGKLYKSNLFFDLRFQIDKYNEDMFIIYKIFHKAKKIVYDKRQFYYYSQEGTSLTRSEFNYKKLDMVEAVLEWYHFIKENYPRLERKAKIKYLTVMIDTCTLLSKQNDNFGRKVFKDYSKEIIENYYVYMSSKLVRKNDKIKATLIKLRLYRFTVRLRNKYYK